MVVAETYDCLTTNQEALPVALVDSFIGFVAKACNKTNLIYLNIPTRFLFGGMLCFCLRMIDIEAKKQLPWQVQLVA